MAWHHRSGPYALLGTSILLAGVAVETTRLVLQAPWGGWSLWFSNTISTLLSIIWTAAIIGLSVRRKHPKLALTAWLLSVAAPFTMTAHGVFTRLGGVHLGLLYVAGGVLVGFCMKRVWDGSEYRWLSRNTS